ncbi:GNAT family N-acetyltransferase [Taibaiella sp. KBW10]|nr:GNAT family N-acetyltransferase [Taibaiella sp. KBW10]
MTLRIATLEDIPQMQRIRNTVTENTLSDPGLVTDADYREYMCSRGKGWVCDWNGEIVGFAIADMQDHNVWALFVKTGWAQKGIGRQLHDTLLDWYFAQTKETLWLGTAPATRAETFYRKAGWLETGRHGQGEIKFEMTYQNWLDKQENPL